MSKRHVLPVDAVLDTIREVVRRERAVVVEAPPGTGKTTRVPAALLDVVEGEVWVLEPRRVAARASAARVALERGETLGDTVGYRVRFERQGSAQTRLWYVTEALLTRRLVEDPELRGIGAIVLDEFHERSLHTDLAFAYVRALRARRPDLALVVMSATLDADRIALALGAQRVRVEAPLFPLDVQHVARVDDRPVEVRVAAAVRACADRGDMLVFLPGIGEIHRCVDSLADCGREVVPLHGELDARAQDRALARGSGPRVVLATNVAETSVTVDGVDTVIDLGTARRSDWDPWSGLPTLALLPVSRASAIQRAGRAARQGPGLCLRLYPRADFDARPMDTPPELQRADLAGLVLDLAVSGITTSDALPWLDAPPPAAWQAARTLLQRLRALDEGGEATPLGRLLARIPAHPRIGRLLVEGAALGVGAAAASLAAALGEPARGGSGRAVHDPIEAALEGRGGRNDVRRQLEGAVPRGPLPAPAGAARCATEELALVRACFVAFSDRVGRRRGHLVTLAEGGRAELEHGTPGGDGIVLVLDAERVGGRVRARGVTPLPEDWLLDDAEVRTLTTWTGSRVEAREALVYGAVVLEESPGQGDPVAIAELLFENVAPIAHRVFPDHDRAEALVHRVDWLRRAGVDLPELRLRDLVREACTGLASLASLEDVSLVATARGLAPEVFAHLDALAPERIDLPGRARVQVHYPPDGDPYVASRMQDFFGLREGPRIGQGHPLVLHLLAPNQRPVQVTTDLRGFWERHWPTIRRELMRRYPRHAWPEDPRQLFRDDGP